MKFRKIFIFNSISKKIKLAIIKLPKGVIRAIIPTHVFGHISNMDELMKLCNKV